jgi:hypothetical protein
MVRFYSEKFFDTMDDRADLNFMRLLGRLYLDAQITDIASFHADLVSIGQNPVFPPRVIGGTGSTSFGLTQIYGEIITPHIPLFDLTRFRFGRQHYKLGQGLTLGDSYYMTDNYDGLRVDLSRGRWTIGLLGAITGQDIAPGGFRALPGSDQLYVGKLECELYNHILLAYSVYEKPRGDFNDNTIVGMGANGSIILRDLRYFGEFGAQKFHTLSGLPDKGGVAYMAGVSYSWSMGPFRLLKAEVRHAAYQGDDATTDEIEIFSPFYPSWWWGDVTAYANGDIGGDWPHRGIRVEGSRVWYGRFYFSPAAIPKLRLQFQYATVADWVNNDGVTEPDDEAGIKLFYEFNANVRVQARYFRRMSNSPDVDINNSGTITRIEDSYSAQRVLLEFRVKI